MSRPRHWNIAVYPNYDPKGWVASADRMNEDGGGTLLSSTQQPTEGEALLDLLARADFGDAQIVFDENWVKRLKKARKL